MHFKMLIGAHFKEDLQFSKKKLYHVSKSWHVYISYFNVRKYNIPGIKNVIYIFTNSRLFSLIGESNEHIVFYDIIFFINR